MGKSPLILSKGKTPLKFQTEIFPPLKFQMEKIPMKISNGEPNHA